MFEPIISTNRMEHYMLAYPVSLTLASPISVADKNPELQSFITLGSTAIRYHHVR